MELILDKLHKLRASRGNPSFELIAEKGDVPVGTVKNLFYGKSRFPNIDTMYKIVVVALEGSLDKLFSDSEDLSIGNVQELKEENAKLKADAQALACKNVALLARSIKLSAELRAKNEVIKNYTELIKKG